MLWSPRTNAKVKKLRQENDKLRSSLVHLRRQRTTKQNRASGLELLLQERLQRIDELNAKLEQARAINHRLEEECEHLAQLVARSQPENRSSNDQHSSATAVAASGI